MDHTVQKKALEDSGRYIDSSLRIAAPPSVKRTDGKGGTIDTTSGGDSAGSGNHGAGGRRRAWSTPVGHDYRQLSDRHLQEKLTRKAAEEVKQSPKDDPLVMLIMLIGVDHLCGPPRHVDHADRCGLSLSA